MKIKQLGSNQTQAHLGKWTVLFSYETPVAALDDKTGKYYQSDKKYSSTTSKHINKWLGDKKNEAEKKPESFFQELVKESKTHKAEAHKTVDMVSESLSELFGKPKFLNEDDDHLYRDSEDEENFQQERIQENNIPEDASLLIDGSAGIYVPARFAKNYDMTSWGISDELAEEISDPDNETYWDAWDEVLRTAKFKDDDGNVWTLMQDDDLFAVPSNSNLDESADGEDFEGKWGSTSSGLIEIKFPSDILEDFPMQGDVEDAARAAMSDERVASQLAKIKPETIAKELKEYGAWDDDELQDQELNKMRLVWLMISDVKEDGDSELDESANLTESDNDLELQDIIDTRDLESKLEELDENSEDYKMILQIKNFFIKEYQDGEDLWNDGITLIRDSYFEDYLREQVEETGELEKLGKWEMYINWEAYARDTAINDYSSIDINGIEFKYHYM